MPKHNVIDEAKYRHEYERREAFGEVDGEKVYLITDINRHGNPYVTALYGGEWYHYEEEGLDDEFGGATSQRKTFEKAQRAIWYFEEVVDDYGLVEELPDSWTEGNAANA